MKISTVLDKIDDNQLFVPAFQREYVWKRDDAKSLIDSLVKQYPTGTMLTWETSTPPALKGQYKHHEKQGAIKLVLDGQQRITTLYMLIRGELPPYYTSTEITHDPRGLYVNVKTLELSYYQKTRMGNDPNWQNITDIFQGKISLLGLIKDSLGKSDIDPNDKGINVIEENLQRIKNIVEHQFPEQTIPIKATIREAIDIFYKVNASGIALTDAELALAQISGYWPEARDLFKKKLADLSQKGFVFKLDFIIYALLGCLYHLGSDMQRLHSEEKNKDDIQHAWELLSNKVLDYVMNLLRTRAYVDHTKEVNSVYALIPIIVFFYDKYKRGMQPIPDDQLRRIVKWFYYSQIHARYVHQLPQKLDFDLRIIKESEKPFEELISILKGDHPLEIDSEEFEGRATTHPLFGLMKWYFKSQNAMCFTTGLGIHETMGEQYKLEHDHIFPYSGLKKAGYGKGNRIKYALAQEMTNRAILTQLANRGKSATSAAEYLTEVKKTHPKALEKQCIPLDEELWEIDRYEDFLVARRKLLAEQLNQFLESLTVQDEIEVAGKVILHELIAEGENQELEFKSSLRWDYREGKVNKKLESVIVKTVAAFANSDGGILLIGINDTGDPLGLENDYASLRGDSDKFERHLRNLLNEQIEVLFVAKNIKVSFPVIQGVEICQIDVSPATSPQIVKVKGQPGPIQEKFYFRNGNSSQELTMSEFDSYREQRFS